MARPAGFEPATHGLEGRCSIRLSYGRLLLVHAKQVKALRQVKNGRSGGIRTPDILLPKQTRYQAALHSEYLKHSVKYSVRLKEVRIILTRPKLVNDIFYFFKQLFKRQQHRRLNNHKAPQTINTKHKKPCENTRSLANTLAQCSACVTIARIIFQLRP